MLDGLKTLLQKNQLTITPEFNTGKPTREGSQWFVGKFWKLGDKEFYAATFGDFKRDLKLSWSSQEVSSYTEEEKALADKQLEETLRLEKEAKEKTQLDMAVELATEFDQLPVEGSTPYLAKKQIRSLFGCRIKANDSGDPILIVPMRDVSGKFWNFQRIYAQKLSHGDKFFSPGAKIEGCFHTLQGEIKDNETIYICEGFATAASVASALANETCVVAAFNAQNLQPVSVAIREAFPTTKIVVCADNDLYTIIQNKPVNVGLIKGRRAAGATQGTCVFPTFKHPAKGFTDFNDLHAAEGLDTVKDQILHPEKYVKGIQPMCLQTSKSGKPVVPSEKQMTEYILEYYKGRIVRQDKSLFWYKNSHWVELDPMAEDRLKQKIQIAANGLFNARDIENHFKYLRIHCPQVPIGTDLFTPNPFAANFRNGTLHFWRNGSKKYHVEFRKHDATDYLTSVLPFDYSHWQPGAVLPPAPKFDAMIETLWAKNLDKTEIQRFVYQLGGACLAPAFPILAFFWGKPLSGKSTIVKLLVKMLSKENVCSVQPCDMHGFNMETMVGRLVNFDTDIDTNKPMNDSEIKKIIDRMPRRIRRKSLDGSSHAYGHRMILVHTESFKAKPDDETDFEDRLLREESDGIVARFVMGLYDLLENYGKFTQPSSNAQNVANLENDSDMLGQFLLDIEEGGVMDKQSAWSIEPGAKIKRALMWEKFSAWQQESLVPGERIGKHKFFKDIEHKGFKVSIEDGVRYFESMRVTVQKDAVV